MKTQPIFFLALFLFPLFVSAQCTVSAGSDTTFCSPNIITDPFYLGGNVVIQNGTAPYTYEWSGSYQDPIFGLRTASYYLDDTTAANPEIVAFSWDHADTSSLNGMPFYLEVTDAMGLTCRDTISISYTKWFLNLDDCTFWVPIGTPVGLRHNVAGGIPPYTFSWYPSTGLNDSTASAPIAMPDSSTTYWVTVTDQTGCSFQNNCTIYLTSSSIDVEKAYRLFSISPNPMRTSALIRLDNLNFQGAHAEIIDLHGKIVFSEAFTSSRMDFSSENLPKGIYLCQIKEGTQLLATKKLIIVGE